jgi:hypothetical protein
MPPHGQAAVILLATAFVAGAVCAPEARSAPVETVYQAKQLTPEQFRRLPDSAVIEVRGKRFTAGELRAIERRNAGALKASKGAATKQPRLEAQAQRAKFLQGEKAKLNAENAKIRATYSARHRVRAVTALAGTARTVMPTITEIVGTVRPGAALYIKGMSFGNDGEVLLRGLPQGIVTLPLDDPGERQERPRQQGEVRHVLRHRRRPVLRRVPPAPRVRRRRHRELVRLQRGWRFRRPSP